MFDEAPQYLLCVEDFIKINCCQCGVEVNKPKGEVVRAKKIGRNLCCSVSCGSVYSATLRRKKMEEEYSQNPKLCECCKTPIDFNKRNDNKFCSSSCSAKINNGLYPKKKVNPFVEKIVKDCKPHQRKIRQSCSRCNSEFVGRGYRKFCGWKCSSDAKTDEIVLKIENGEQCSQISIKRYLISKNGEKCFSCGWDKKNPVTNKVPLDMHHVDGNNENNVISNFQLLCPNCHSLTPTYKALNKGKGRKDRREIYQRGKESLTPVLDLT